MAMAFQRSRVLLTAVELRVFSAIADGEMTSREVAGRLHTHERATDRLLNALCAMGLVEKAGGRFRNAPASRRYLVEGRPEFIAGLGHTASMWRSWSHLTESVREGRPAIREAINDRGDDWLA
ncbi:MAG: acetylserotonin O-methyltransferase, partial [Acidobacteria bacterium]|nr:acetylserotonin O-methyltransferase [Acidobacteriota bacterium]